LTAAPASTAPLAGIRVLDLSWLLPGPFFTGMFADLGADVLKVERPGDGDYARTLLPGLFQLVNRGKRSAVLDLREPGDRNVLLRLSRDADVFVEGFRPGVVQRLGVDYEAVRQMNSRIVYVSLTGYGQHGPAALEPGHDVNYCARAGLMAIPARVGDGNAASRMQLPVSDLAGAMYAAFATLAALRRRDNTGEGAWLDVSLADTALAWSAVRWADAPRDAAGNWRHVNAANDVFTAADGARVAVALVESHFWDAFVAALDPAQGKALRGCEGAARQRLLQQIFAARTAGEWLAFARQRDLPITAVAASYDDLLADVSFKERDMWLRPAYGSRPMPAFPIRMTPRGATADAPGFGSDSAAARQGWDAVLQRQPEERA
jgi:crotonobetainyl-CoA:carnitine CoA-transferase CaiB-like acyl-CoA transferase